MNEKNRGRIRWKRQPYETGLAATGAAPRGWVLHDGVEDYATVSPNGGGWRKPQNGWYWHASVGDAIENTCRNPVQEPDEAKAAAMAFVRSALAEAGGAK